MLKHAWFLAALALAGCTAAPLPVPGGTERVTVPSIEQIQWGAMEPNTGERNQAPPPLRADQPDQRAVIARVLDQLAAAEPVSDPGTRYVDHSPVFRLYFHEGGGVALAPAYQCRSAPPDCQRVEGEVTFFPPDEAPPVRLRSSDLVAWLEGGWRSNWPAALPPMFIPVDIQVRDGSIPAGPAIGGAEVTFESEAGERYAVLTDSDGKAGLTVLAVPVVTSGGSKRCASYRVTVSAAGYKTELIESMPISPYAGMVYFHPSLPKGDGVWKVTDDGECLPDQQTWARPAVLELQPENYRQVHFLRYADSAWQNGSDLVWNGLVLP
ncbi:MAG TPA: carboxypeptidase-like regulatory domain-containing protein [Symbiobacteriaceae bacterium]|nr:carboxypeptidase-like regulatory domain-containing protein [Symbiobacteriaceae bacterium]